MPDFEERTEQATPRRREKAREKGSVPRSRELISMFGTGGIILFLYFAGGSFIKNAFYLTQYLLSSLHEKDIITVMNFAFPKMMSILMPFWMVPFIFVIFAGALQGGFVFKPLGFEFERINPLGGLKKIFSLSGLFELLKSVFKFLIGGALFYYIVKKSIKVIPFTSVMNLQEITTFSVRFIAKAVITVFIVFLVLALIDYIIERWRFERSIRMTRQELKEEMKEYEGDPLIKSRIKSIQKELARKRMMQEVPKATVVITNPTHIAVALMYRKDETPAPKVIAKGVGFIAEKIKEIARKHGIPVVEDKPLAQALYKLNIGSTIPEELYRAVARILAYIYKVRKAI
jgi:flagellar biosynthetic protein FlhB